MTKITKILMCGSLVVVAIIAFFILSYLMIQGPVFIHEVKIIEPIADEVNLDKFDYNECLSLLNKEELEELDQNENISCKSIIEKSIKDCPYKLKRISDMKEARARHKAIKLNNGKVLIIGGDEKESAELFDPKTNTFTLVVESINPFISPNVTPYVSGEEIKAFDDPILLSNGKVYYQGATYDPETNTFFKATSGKEKKLLDFLKNISSKKWLKQNNSEVMNILPDGKTLFAKDCKYEYGCSEVYLNDPLNNYKYIPAKLNTKRSRFSSILLDSGKILIIGGQITDKNGKMKGINNTELYDPITGKILFVTNFDGLKPIKIDKENIFIISPELCVGKGSFCFYTNILDFKKLKTIPTVTLPFKLNLSPSIYKLNDNFLLVIEGSYANILDLNSKKAYKLMNPNLSSYGQTFTLLDNGNVLITGGNYIDGPTNSITELSKYAAILSLKDKN